MNDLIPYILKSTLCISLFYLAFRLVMRKETFFALNRMVLLIIVVFSIIIPLLHLPQSVKPLIREQIISQIQFNEVQMQSLEVAESPISAAPSDTGNEAKPLPYSTGQIFLFIYLAGMFASLLYFLHGIIAVLFMLRKAQPIKKEGYRLFILGKDIPAFSFGKMVFISQTDYLDHGTTILAHEQQHVRLGHFYDLLLMELAKMIHWFNPVIYLLIQDLKAIHEYQADQQTLTKGIDATTYQLLIIEKGVGQQRLALANSFNHCQIKKRITMMNKQKTGKAWRWKVATFLPLLALLLMAFGREVVNEPPAQGLLSSLEITSPQDSVKQWAESDFNVFSKETKEKIFFEGKTFVIIQIDADSRISVDDESLALNDIPGQVRKWIDYNYAEQKEHIHFNKISINGQTKMSPATVITVRKDPNTPQKDYLELLNAVANTVLKVRGDYSKEIFNTSYNKISANQRKEIDKLIPMNVAVTNAQLKKFEIAPPPPLQSFNIEMRKDGNYINNRLIPLEEIRKKAEAYHKSNANAVVSIKADKDVPQERVTEIREVLRNVKIQNVNALQDNSDDHVYNLVEEMPEFPGGDKALREYIAKSVQYPKTAQEKNIQGKVFVNFIITSQGKVEKPKVVRGVSPELDSEALRVISLMPTWKPGKEKGKPVSVFYTIPINFVLSAGPSEKTKKDITPPPPPPKQ